MPEQQDTLQSALRNPFADDTTGTTLAQPVVPPLALPASFSPPDAPSVAESPDTGPWFGLPPQESDRSRSLREARYQNNLHYSKMQDAEYKKYLDAKKFLEKEAAKPPEVRLDQILQRTTADFKENAEHKRTIFTQGSTVNGVFTPKKGGDTMRVTEIRTRKTLAEINPLDVNEKDIPTYLKQIETAYSRAMPNAMQDPHVQSALFDLGQTIRAHHAQKRKLAEAERQVKVAEKRQKPYQDAYRQVMLSGGRDSAEAAYYRRKLERMTDEEVAPAQYAVAQEQSKLGETAMVAGQTYQNMRSGASRMEQQIVQTRAQAEYEATRQDYFDNRRMNQDAIAEEDRAERKLRREEEQARAPYEKVAKRVEADLGVLQKRRERLENRLTGLDENNDADMQARPALEAELEDVIAQETVAQEQYNTLSTHLDPTASRVYGELSKRYRGITAKQRGPVQTRLFD